MLSLCGGTYAPGRETAPGVEAAPGPDKARGAGRVSAAGGGPTAGGTRAPPRVPVLLAAGGAERHLCPDPRSGPGRQGSGAACLLLAGGQPPGAGSRWDRLRLREGDPGHAAP